ncbi:hypothetical protein Dda_1186 [Drechslerella dactyloides]|uniref:Uncharacterized protein n=1 Tax=Drechslerella dactyloides TaxID=74499 RepID=A0AAD6NMS3_DREDA|nr:hypothetical protein Dda_1186 [Drechslerella dactyloides]
MRPAKTLLLTLPLTILSSSALPLYAAPRPQTTLAPPYASPIRRRAKDINPDTSGFEPIDNTNQVNEPTIPTTYTDSSIPASHALELAPPLPPPLPPPDEVRPQKATPDPQTPSKPAQPNPSVWKKLVHKDDTIRM